MDKDNEMKKMISIYLDGELSEAEKTTIEELLQKDSTAQKYYREMQKLRSSLKTWRDEDLSPDLEQRIMQNWRDAKEGRGGTMKRARVNVYRFAGGLVVLFMMILSYNQFMKKMVPMPERKISMEDTLERPTKAISKDEVNEVEKEFIEADKDDAEVPEIASTTVPHASIPASVGVIASRTAEDMTESYKRTYFSKGMSQRQLVLANTSGPVDKVTLASLPASQEVIGGVFVDEGKAVIRRSSFGFKSDTSNMQSPALYAILGAPGDDAEVSQIVVKAKKQNASKKPKILARRVRVDAQPFIQVFRGGRVLGEDLREAGYVEGIDYNEVSALSPDPAEQPYRSKSLIVPFPDNESRWQQIEREAFSTEQYERIYENAFLKVSENPLSTFSIDVDTASYANVRRFLNNNQFPPADAVRIEEMINYFVYDYPQPHGEDPFSITTEMAKCPWNSQHHLTLIGLQGKELSAEDLRPSNLVFLIDVSGSMQPENKLPLLKKAFKQMVQQLRAEERIAIVTYSGSAGLVLDSTAGSEKQTILSAVDRLQAGGSTAGGQGIRLAYKVAKQHFIPNGNNRVILATDGDFNVGISSDGELVRIIEEKRKDGIFLTVLGFGTGNYKNAKMEKIADKGNGNYYYIDTFNEAQKVLVKELGSTLFTIAKDVKIQIEFNPAQVKAYRLVGYENRVLAKEDFNDDTKDAGEMGAGHSVTALYEIVPVNSLETFGEVDPLKYQQTIIQESPELMTIKLRYKRPQKAKSQLIEKSLLIEDYSAEQISDNFRFAAAVAEFGLLLRDSQYKGEASFLHVLEQAKKAKGADHWGYRSELIQLIEKAGLLVKPQPRPDPYSILRNNIDQ